MSKNLKGSASYLLDAVDLQMLRTLQADARISNSALSEQVHLSESPCWRRWKKLEDEGYIDEYRTVLNRKKLGFTVSGFTQVSLSSHDESSTDQFELFVTDADWIPLCHCTTGSADYLVQIIARDLEEYYERLNQLRRVKWVSAIQSSVSVKEVKSNNLLPLS